MKHILIISFSDLSTDPRVSRQIHLLRRHYRVTAAGYADPKALDVEFVKITPVPRTRTGRLAAIAMLKLEQFERFYWSSAAVAGAREALAGRSFDMILANEIQTVPLALSLESKLGAVLDAHEYSPRESEDSWRWRFLFQRYIEYLCRQYIPNVAGMVTVCEGIAEEYSRNFGSKPSVVHSAPYRAALSPRPSANGVVRLVHHGSAIPSRKIENMIEMMAHLDDRFTLDFYLVQNEPGYMDRLRRAASRDVRIRFLPPVAMAQLPAVLNGYDMGVYILEPNNFNNRLALPNKLFEFIQGRIAIAIGPSPEMARVVRQFDCGIVAADFLPRTLAEDLSRLTPERLDHYKQQADAAARDLCYENASQTLLRVLATVETSRDSRAGQNLSR